jgi:hypothetical protein
MAEFDSRVKFSSGAPLDINKLNSLQDNITSVYQLNNSAIQTIGAQNTSISGIQKNIQVFPIIDRGTQEIEVNGGQKVFPFSNTNFSEIPIIVASLNFNPKKETWYTVSAIAKSTTQYALEVTAAAANSGTKVSVNWIAVQMKVIQFD